MPLDFIVATPQLGKLLDGRQDVEIADFLLFRFGHLWQPEIWLGVAGSDYLLSEPRRAATFHMVQGHYSSIAPSFTNAGSQ